VEFAVEMDTGVMMYIPSFIKTGSTFEKLIREIHREHDDRQRLLLFIQNKENKILVVLHVTWDCQVR
jgi:hypothetical protein